MNFLFLLFLLGVTPAAAGVPCTLPFTPPAALVSGQVADPSQLVANYNALVTCLGGAAAAGANSDITSLSALTSLSPTQGGTPVFIGTNTSTGTANAQVVAATLPASFSLTSNFKVIFKAGFTNLSGLTSGHNTTLQVGSTVVTPVFRPTTGGAVELAGGEIIAGTITEAVFDGTQFQLMSNISPFPVGTVLETVGATPDPGFLLLNGACQLTTTFAALWNKLGNPVPGACPAIGGIPQFPLPQSAGAFIVSPGGSLGAALLGVGGGSATLSEANIPSLSAGRFSTPISDTRSYQVQTAASGTGAPGVVLSTSQAASGSINVVVGGAGAITATTSYSGLDGAFSVIPSYLALNRQIKY